MPENNERKKIYCNKCASQTNHELKDTHHVNEFDEGPVPIYTTMYSLWICLGCETGTLEVGEFFRGMSEEEISFRCYPERRKNKWKIKPFIKLPVKLKGIYRETVRSYDQNNLILCTAGMRALLEGVCADKGAKGRNLKAKIDGLEKHIPNETIIDSLHHFRFTGNKALHQLEAPIPAKTRAALEVIEGLLAYLYELDYKAGRLIKK